MANSRNLCPNVGTDGHGARYCSLGARRDKNEEGRAVYLDRELLEAFSWQWNRRKEMRTALPFVFLNQDGTDRVKRFDKAWKTSCKKAKIGVRLFHDFRRTAVRNMVCPGVTG